MMHILMDDGRLLSAERQCGVWMPVERKDAMSKSRAEIPIEWQKQVGPRTLRLKVGTDILIAKGDIIELQISDVAGPFIVSMVRELDLPGGDPFVEA
jgi:hypothetical protein